VRERPSCAASQQDVLARGETELMLYRPVEPQWPVDNLVLKKIFSLSGEFVNCLACNLSNTQADSSVPGHRNTPITLSCQPEPQCNGFQ
jgi:hypothetical protein